MSSPALFTTLPYELLAIVFLLVPSRDHSGTNPADRSDYRELVHTVTNISAVCSVWRQVAIGTADLWTTIHVGPNFSLQERSNKARERLAVFLQRSKTALLDISIGQVDSETTWMTSWSIVAPHLERSRSLSIELFEAAEAMPVLKILEESTFHFLEWFELMDSRTGPLDDHSSPLKRVFGQQLLPRLNSLDYHAMYRPPPPTPVAPWLQTLTLTAPYLPHDQFILLLETYPHLVSLTIGLSRWKEVALSVDIVLPELRALATNCPAVFSHIITPALSSLTLSGVTSSDWEVTPVFSPTGRRTFSHLEELRSLWFDDCELSLNDRLTALLRQAEALKSVQTEHCRGTPDFLFQFTIPANSQETVNRHILNTAQPVDLETTDDGENKSDESRFLLPSLAHVSIMNDLSRNSGTPEMVMELLSRRTSVHVDCDLWECRDIYEDPRNHFEGDDGDGEGPTSYLRGRLLILDGLETL